MNLPDYYISCDWGTSNFRLQKVDTQTGQVICGYTTDKGIKECFAHFSKQNGLGQKQFFVNYLLEQLEKSEMIRPDKTLIVASGMLSSSIGLQELEYATLPVSFGGDNLISKLVHLDARRDLLLISGVRSDVDVMRGEETQAIGLAEFLPGNGSGILLLPGTHSKHLNFISGYFTNIQTYMTGELFELLVKNSILKSALESTGWNPAFEGEFLTGVKKGIEKGMMDSLFSIRANNLIYRSQPEGNYFYLSGLLIGAELSYLRGNDEIIFLAASGLLSELYRRALESFLSLDRIVHYDPLLVDKAVLAGQKKILQSYV